MERVHPAGLRISLRPFAWMMTREVFPRLRTFYNNIDMGAFHGQRRIDRVLGAETYHTRAFPLDDTK